MRALDWFALAQPIGLYFLHAGARRLKRIERKLDKNRRVIDQHHERLVALEQRRAS